MIFWGEGLKSSTENNNYKFGIKNFVSIKYITEKIVIFDFFLNHIENISI